MSQLVLFCTCLATTWDGAVYLVGDEVLVEYWSRDDEFIGLGWEKVDGDKLRAEGRVLDAQRQQG